MSSDDTLAQHATGSPEGQRSAVTTPKSNGGVEPSVSDDSSELSESESVPGTE